MDQYGCVIEDQRSYHCYKAGGEHTIHLFESAPLIVCADHVQAQPLSSGGGQDRLDIQYHI